MKLTYTSPTKLLLSCVILFSSLTLSAFSGGNGTVSDPYLISNCQELQNIRNNLSAHYKLTADIDCKDFDSGDGHGFAPIGGKHFPFTGKLDGNNHKIQHLQIKKRANDHSVGLFAFTNGVSIINLTLTDAVIDLTGSGSEVENAGILVGYGFIDDPRSITTEFSKITISNGSIKEAKTMGGLIGFFEWRNLASKFDQIKINNVNISNASRYYSKGGGFIGSMQGNQMQPTSCGSGCRITNVEVSGGSIQTRYAGGLIGSLSVVMRIQPFIIENSHASVNITIPNQGSTGPGGGLIGFISGSGEAIQINKSWSAGDLQGIDRLGGLIGHISGKIDISRSYSKTSVKGRQSVGGLIGEIAQFHGQINNTYAQGSVTGTRYVGGLVGRMNQGDTKILDSYAAGRVSGPTNGQTGGLIGYAQIGAYNVIGCYWDRQASRVSTSAAGVGKTTAEMKQKWTFKNWDFTEIWTTNNDTEYPSLQTRE